MPRTFSKARQRKITGKMNKTEEAYSRFLDLKLSDGSILDWKYEPIKFRLADNTYYTPDFMVVMSDNTIEFREVKGSWKAPHQEDSRVKIKVAAEMFWQFRFSCYVPVGGLKSGQWEREEFG